MTRTMLSGLAAAAMLALFGAPANAHNFEHLSAVRFGYSVSSNAALVKVGMRPIRRGHRRFRSGRRRTASQGSRLLSTGRRLPSPAAGATIHPLSLYYWKCRNNFLPHCP